MQRRVGAVRGVLRDLYKLVSLGFISKSMYNALKKKTVSEQRKALYKYQKKYKIPRGEFKSLKDQVKAISAALQNERATHIHRKRNVEARIASVNSMNLSNFTIFSTSTIEDATANLRYFDPATNTLVTADPSSGTYQRELEVSKLYCKVIARNNYQVPCRYTIYFMTPKVDTSTTPTSFFTAGLADQGNPSSTSPLVYLTDSQLVKENWKIDNSVTKVMNPGQECIGYWSTSKPFEYDFSNVDSHNLLYQKKYGSMCIVTRVEGVIGHDSSADQQGCLQAGVDLEILTKYEFKYDAGKNLHDLSISDGASTFTNGGVVSSKPVSDNIGYSLS